jgi:Sec-independent protein translocase protein TatA
VEWYWWVLIGVGVVVIGYAKIKVLGKWTAAAKAKKAKQAELEDE